MDLWLECITDKKHSITKGLEYQVVNIDPLTGLIRVINNNNRPCWFSEKCFKKKREEDVKMDSRKKTYIPIIADFNVLGKTVDVKLLQIDPNLPDAKSLNEYFGIPALFGVNLTLHKSNNGIMILFEEGIKTENYGVYASNVQAVDAAARMAKTVALYNSVITKIEYAVEPAYVVRFSPDGKDYIFRSVNDLSVGDTVVCDSVSGKQYAKVNAVIELSVEDWHTRAYCRRA